MPITFQGVDILLLFSIKNSRNSENKYICKKINRGAKHDTGKNTSIKNKGSITLETAISLPVFISVILSVSLLMKITYTYEIIQNAISHTANEISSYSYLYHLSGMEGIHNRLHEKIDEIIGKISTDENPGSKIQDVKIINFELPDELKSILYSIIKGVYDDSVNQLFIPITKMCIRKYLTTDEIKDPDERLKMLDIEGGFTGLDFSMSEFFEDDNDTISIVVRYKINIPVPIKILPRFTVIQKATVRGWLGGDDEYARYRDEENDEDIWSLDNFTRGRKIRELFGANLPFTFPVIARYDNDSGTITMIKSMDLTLAYYQDPAVVSKKIRIYIDELKAYKGQETPWGRDKIVIKNSNIAKRQLTLVIPGNSIVSVVMKEIEQCRFYAANNGVDLNVVKYGKKQIFGEETEDEETGDKESMDEESMAEENKEEMKEKEPTYNMNKQGSEKP
jgi:hypothetical protein